MIETAVVGWVDIPTGGGGGISQAPGANPDVVTTSSRLGFRGGCSGLRLYCSCTVEVFPIARRRSLETKCAARRKQERDASRRRSGAIEIVDYLYPKR